MHFVCEIPQMTRKKFEIATVEVSMLGTRVCALHVRAPAYCGMCVLCECVCVCACVLFVRSLCRSPLNAARR